MDLNNKKILIISPHPDDEVISCGGLIELAKSKKTEVFIFYICVGKCRQLVTGITDENTRLKELDDVSKYGNFKYKILFIGKEFVRLDTIAQKDIIDPIEDVIADFKPDIICIPNGHSYDQDHRAVYTACMTALRPVPRDVRHFVSIVLMCEEPYTWTVSDIFKPNFYINISGFEKSKSDMMSIYKSQDRKYPFPRSKENLINYARIRGSEIGVEAAEAYYLLRGVFN